MRLLRFFFCLLVFPVLSAEAQGVKPVVPPKLTLAQALSAVPRPSVGLRLTVGAEKVALRDGTDAPATGASLDQITSAFGERTANFGDIVAVAPSSMVLLNPNPGPPDIAADMKSVTALALLASSLTDSQWSALISEQGIGLADLTDDTQRSLFHALFPNGQLLVGSEDPVLADVPREKRTDVRDLTDQIDGTRIRLTQTSHFYLHNQSGGTIYFSGNRPDAAGRRHFYSPKAPPLSAQHTVSLRAEVPNALKSSDLDWNSKALRVSVPVVGLKCVGDLVERIGQETHLELYADPHYAGKTVTVSGPATSAPADDLLRAVCLCVTGTFRKVGSAYVLTDDLIGVGVRRKHLTEWEDAANLAEQEIRQKLAPALLEHHAADVRKLQAFGDPFGLSPEEVAALLPDEALPPLPRMFDTDFPFAKLSAAQQAWMKQRGEEYEASKQNGQSENAPPPDFTHNVGMRMNMQLQLIVPTESQAVDTNLNSLMFSLFVPDMATMMAATKAKEVEAKAKLDADAKAKALAKMPPAPLLSAMLHHGNRRALLAHPYSVADVDASVAAMQKLGLNQLWLNVFSGGASHLQTNAASDADILTEALNKTRGTGIAVFADLSLLCWGAEPPDSMRDLTIDGKDSRQAAVDDNATSPNENYDDEENLIPFVAPSVYVSPSAPAVEQTLSALMQDLVARPGLAGLVWEDAETNSSVGYTPLMREGFLRAFHADPVDIADSGYSRIDLSLPLFDDPKVDAALPGQWTKFSADSGVSLLLRLRAAAQRGSGPALPILLPQDGFGDDKWFVDWNDPKQPSSLRAQQADGLYVPPEKITEIANTRGRILVRCEAIKNDGDTPTLARMLRDDAKDLPSAGFVLDFSQESVTQGAAPLDSLVQAVAAEKAKRGVAKGKD